MSKKRVAVFAVVLYMLLAFAVNNSLLLGLNVMKWDIWNAEYPLHIITTDAINAGTFPIWMPLMDYGTPYYAMLGTPIWYPFTLFFDVIGYGPYTPGWEYSLHMLIGALGMFFLALRIKEKTEKALRLADYIVPLSMGVFYEFSGIYLSNAEQIMITISMAWIPYVLLFAEKYISEKKFKYCMTAGLCAGLILLGGYPEMFFDTFLVLIVWTLYWSFQSEGTKTIIKTGVFAMLKLAAIGLVTCMFAAISLIPFIMLMSNITRGGGQEVSTFPFVSLLSAILPVSADQIIGEEISMGLFYTGIGTLISLPLVFRIKDRQAKFFFVCSVVALYLCFGRNSLLHTCLYYLVPMYSSFRFPTLWRAFFTIFALLAVQAVWIRLREEKVVKIFNIISSSATVLALLGTIVTYIIFKTSEGDIAQTAKTLCMAFILLFCILGCYALAGLLLGKRNKAKYLTLVLGIVVVIETLAVGIKAFPVMSARFETLSCYQNEAVKINIANEKVIYDNRNTTVNFVNSERSVSGEFNSFPSAINKSFDEDGYFSAALSKTEEFKNTKLREVMRECPMAFFSNDIVDSTDVKLENWRNSDELSASRVYIESKEGIAVSDNDDSSAIITEFTFTKVKIECDAKSEGVLTLLQANYPGWNLYIDGNKTEITEVDGVFIGAVLKEGKHEITLEFVPVDFYIGAAITSITIIAFVIVLILSARKKEKVNA